VTEPPAFRLAVRPSLVDARTLALVLLGAALLGAALWTVRWTVASSHAQGDTFWYTRQALLYAGYPESDATAIAADFIVGQGRGVDPAGWISAAETLDSRYIGIFASRPVYPLVAAQLVGILGTGAMAAATALAAMAFAAALAALVWPAAGATATFVAILAAFALPTGGWLAVMYADGWMFATLTASLAAAAAFLRTDRRAWLAAFALSVLVLYATKSANAIVLVVATVLLAIASVMLTGSLRTRVVELAAVAVAVGGLMTVTFGALGLPGLTETVQDLLTEHFDLPDVASPWPQLLQQAAALGRTALFALAGQPVVLAAALIGLIALAAARTWWAGLVALAGVAAVLTVVVHPVRSEIPRLMAPIWISVAVGWGLVGAAGASWLQMRLRTPRGSGTSV
jgi:hypothetical protein